jgi:hypothetical protein
MNVAAVANIIEISKSANRMNLIRLKQLPGIDSPAIRLNIRFFTTPKISFQIKNAMKSAISTQSEPKIPSLFQVAAQLEDFTTAHPESAPQISQKMPFADLMMHPEKLAAVLKTAETELPVKSQRATPGKKLEATRPKEISNPSTATPVPRVANLQKNKTIKTR